MSLLNNQTAFCGSGSTLTFSGLKSNARYVLLEQKDYDELMVKRYPMVSAKERAKNNCHAISNMERALKTYRDRNRVYGNNYKRFGAIMEALYPSGVFIKTAHEWNRFGIILQKLSKLSRYVTDPHNGHIDSIHDDAVYSFMLEELDSEQVGMDVTPPAPLATFVSPKDVLPNPCEHIYRFTPGEPETFAPKCTLCGEERGE